MNKNIMANPRSSQQRNEPQRHGLHCFPERVGTWNSSSDSLQGSRASGKQGPSAPYFEGLCSNKPWQKLRRKQESDRQGLGTLSGVLIPTYQSLQSFENVAPDLHPKEETLPEDKLANSNVFCNRIYLISRALGPKLGGAVGCLYWLGVLLLSVLEVLGSVEMIEFTFPSLHFPSANRVIGAIILIFLGTLVFFGIKFVSKLGLAFFAVVIYAMVSLYLGLFLAPHGNAPKTLTGLSWKTFKSNWGPAYQRRKSFSTAVSLFFPCFTGILSGADRATNLRQPEKSIPQGTLGAVVISFVIYLSYMGLWAAVATRQFLLEEPGGEVVKTVAYPLPILTQLAIIVASTAQAMQCLIISPRLLQAIAADGIVPFLGFFAKISKNGEPSNALVLTTFLGVAAAMIGNLNAVAPLVSICFLTCYSALNLSCFILSIVNAPSWRPKWKYYHWSAALIGFIFCAALAFVIVWYWAVVAVILLIFIYAYIDLRQVEVNWGTGVGGLRLQIAVRGILSVGDEARYTVNWRPQLLCFTKPCSLWTKEQHAGHKLLSFASQLKKGQGLCVVTAIIRGKLEEMAVQAAAERMELENHMNEAKVTGFGRVLVSPCFREGKTYAIQASGLGSLEPNTLVMGWPNKWREQGKKHCAEHKVWRKCQLRVHTVAEKLDNSEIICKNLEKLLEQVRIEAEVQVLELEDADLAPYTFDYTLRMEEAQAFAREVANYRKTHEHRGHSSQNISRQTSSKRHHEEKPTLQDRSREGEIQKGGKNMEDVTPYFQLSELDAVGSHSRQRELSRCGALGVLSLGCPNLERESMETRLKHGQNFTESPHYESTPNVCNEGWSGSSAYTSPSVQSSPMSPSLLEKVVDKQAKSEGGETDCIMEENADKEIGAIIPDTVQQLGRQEDDGVAHPNSADQMTTQVANRKGRRVGKERARWADEEGHELESGISGNLEILVDDGFLKNGPEVDGKRHTEMEGSEGGSSQVYPGSHAGINANTEEHEPMIRTWESFSQSYSPKKLNGIIVEQSKDAQLVLLNLPDHYKGMEPTHYMEYCEELTDGLHRVLMVHGTGKELWGGPEA
ncbi:unnamed protein product [Sphagnum troendelagicum]